MLELAVEVFDAEVSRIQLFIGGMVLVVGLIIAIIRSCLKNMSRARTKVPRKRKARGP
jgi:hypothetical protein